MVTKALAEREDGCCLLIGVHVLGKSVQVSAGKSGT